MPKTEFTFRNPDFTQSYPFLRLYKGEQIDTLADTQSMPPKGGDLWYDTTAEDFPVLRYFNTFSETWVLLQDHYTGASRTSGQALFGDNTLCGNITFSYTGYSSSSSESSESSSEDSVVCTNPYAMFDGEMQRVGIGNLFPETLLHVTDDGADATFTLGQHYDGVAGPNLDLVHTRGTFLVPQDIQASDEIGTLRALVYDSSVLDEVVLGSMSWSAGPTVSGSSTLSIKTHDGTSLTEVISVDEDGNVSIPTLAGSSGDPVLQNDEYLDNSTDGMIKFMPDGTSTTHFGLSMDFTSWGYGVVIDTIKASDGSSGHNLRFDCDPTVGNDVDLNMGNNAASRIRHTVTGNDTLQIGVRSNDATYSGVLALIHSSHFAQSYRSPTTSHTNPNLYVYSHTTGADKYIRFEHDGTDANIVTGDGDISLQPAGGDVNVTGNVAPSGNLDLGGVQIPYNASTPSKGDIYVVPDGGTEMTTWSGAKTTVGFFLDGDGAAITTGAKIDALRYIERDWTISKVRIHTSDGLTSAGTATAIQIMRSTDVDDSDTNIDSSATALNIDALTGSTFTFVQPKSGTTYYDDGCDEDCIGAVGLSDIDTGDYIYPKVTQNGQNLTKLHIYVELIANA